ncbi:MAG: rnhA, partial [Clostridia bacterium]|nr:rnhA [Clostridia bacterium]
MKEVTIYADGACSGNPGPGGYGTVLLYNGMQKELSEGYRDTTNNRMEIMGVIKGLEALKHRCKVTVYSDSKYVVDAIEKGWLANWRKNNWVKSNKEKVLNIDLWKRLIVLMELHEVSF